MAIPHLHVFVRSDLSLRTRVRVKKAHTAHFKRGFSYRSSPLDDGIRAVLVHSVQHGPDKAAEFAGDGCDSDMTMLFMIEAPELFVESVLG